MMNRTFLFGGILIGLMTMSMACGAGNQRDRSGLQKTSGPLYDSVAAARYGADEYGMRKYVMAFLKRGPNRSADQQKANELQMAHLKNIERLAEEGRLVLAGPFFGTGDLRGIYIFSVESIEEAEELTRTDPAIQEGVLEMELHEWYGSAAIMALNDLAKTLAKKSITGEENE